MKASRGDVVLVAFPFSDGRGSKVRPALVVLNDRDNQRLTNTVVAQITSNTFRSLEPTQCLIELTTAEGAQSGLLTDSVVNCVNLATVQNSLVLRILGRLTPSLLRSVDLCLKAALEIP